MVPWEEAVNVAVPPEFKVTVNDAPAWMVSLTVAVMFTVWAALYVPSAVDDVNAVIVGSVVSMVIDIVVEVELTEEVSS